MTTIVPYPGRTTNTSAVYSKCEPHWARLVRLLSRLCYVLLIFCIVYLPVFSLLKPFLCRTRAVGNGELTSFCRVPNPVKPVLRGWCYKTISVSALCNNMHKPTWGFGILYTFVHYVRASLLAVLISYAAGSYPPPREAVITKYWVQNRTTAYFCSLANFVESTASLWSRGPRFSTRSDRVGFMVDRVVLRLVLL